MPWILLSFLPPRRTPTYCRWKDENKKQNRSWWHKPAAGLGAGTGSAWEGGSDLGSRMWGTLGRGAFLHGSAGHGEGRGQLAALGAVSYLPRPLSCPQPARESHRTPWVGFGHRSLVQKNPWSFSSWRWVSITKESPAIGDGVPPPWAGPQDPHVPAPPPGMLLASRTQEKGNPKPSLGCVAEGKRVPRLPCCPLRHAHPVLPVPSCLFSCAPHAEVDLDLAASSRR